MRSSRWSHALVHRDQPKSATHDRPTCQQANLRKRLCQHYARSAEASTLRRTLGCLLAGELGLELRRVGSSGRRTTFVTGEQVLSDWMAQNAFVSWIERARPWELEDRLIQELDLPLNLRDNSRHPFHPKLTEARARCLTAARSLAVLPNAR